LNSFGPEELIKEERQELKQDDKIVTDKNGLVTGKELDILASALTLGSEKIKLEELKKKKADLDSNQLHGSGLHMNIEIDSQVDANSAIDKTDHPAQEAGLIKAEIEEESAKIKARKEKIQQEKLSHIINAMYSKIEAELKKVDQKIDHTLQALANRDDGMVSVEQVMQVVRRNLGELSQNDTDKSESEVSIEKLANLLLSRANDGRISIHNLKKILTQY